MKRGRDHFSPVSLDSNPRRARQSLQAVAIPEDETYGDGQHENGSVAGAQLEATASEVRRSNDGEPGPSNRGTTVPHNITPSHERGPDGYCPGSIICIELRNFMTYDRLETVPGARLNLLIGPNGTGKSSIVCALCVGLAGDPKLLGRAANIKDYVQRGHQKGSVTISLRSHNPNKPIKICRRIDVENKTEWTINGRAAKLQDVKKVTTDFNIQVGNLTQFLPQDRVCEFAKLSATDLLVETQKAVGDPSLQKQQEALINNKKELQKLTAALRLHQTSVEGMERENAELNKDVQRVQQQQQLKQKADRMRQKEAVYKVKKAMAAKKKKEADLKQADEDIAVLRKKIEEAEVPAKQANEECQKARGHLRRLRNEMDPLQTKLEELKTQEQNLRTKVGTKEGQIRQLESTAAGLKERQRAIEEELAKAKQVVADNPPPLAPEDPQLAENKREERELQRQKVVLGKEMAQLEREMEAKQKELEGYRERFSPANSARMKVQRILEREPNMKNAMEWIRLNKHRFKGAVYGPVACEVEVTDPLLAQFLEQHVSHGLWRTFFTICTEDRDLLNTSIRADVTNVKSGGVVDVGSQRPLDERLRSLGVVGRLSDVFTADELVRNTLIRHAGLDRAFYGGAEAEANSDRIGELDVPWLWTPQRGYNWRKSRYNRNITSIQNNLQPCKIFTTSISPQEMLQWQREAGQVEAEKAAMEAQLHGMQEKLAQMEASVRELQNEASKLQKNHKDKANRADSAQRRLVNAEKKLAAFEMSLTAAQGIEQLRREIKQHQAAICKALLQSYDVMKKMAHLQMKTAPYELAIPELEARASAKADVSKKEEEALKLVQYQKQMWEREMAALARAKSERLAEAKKALGVATTEELEAACNAHAEEWDTYPEDLNELRALIEDTLAEANAMLCADPNVIRRYEERQRKIEEERAIIAQKSADVESVNKKIEDDKKEWLPRLRSLVAKINETFGRNFEQMAVAGEVTLDEQGLEFDKYGILIKVKFREEAELQVLSAQHQSGGERSVATIVYLVALQAITQCPFRVVDEINQGMDPLNERKMFQQLVRAASQKNTPQCFILTPKLLPDLDYGVHCTVLNVMNGPRISETLHNEALRSGKSFLAAVRCLAARA